MTVQELIEALKQMPQDAEVYFKRGFYSEYMEINSVYDGSTNEVVLMERKND